MRSWKGSMNLFGSHVSIVNAACFRSAIIDGFIDDFFDFRNLRFEMVLKIYGRFIVFYVIETIHIFSSMAPAAVLTMWLSVYVVPFKAFSLAATAFSDRRQQIATSSQLSSQVSSKLSSLSFSLM